MNLKRTEIIAIAKKLHKLLEPIYKEKQNIARKTLAESLYNVAKEKYDYAQLLLMTDPLLTELHFKIHDEYKVHYTISTETDPPSIDFFFDAYRFSNTHFLNFKNLNLMIPTMEELETDIVLESIGKEFNVDELLNKLISRYNG